MGTLTLVNLFPAGLDWLLLKADKKNVCGRAVLFGCSLNSLPHLSHRALIAGVYPYIPSILTGQPLQLCYLHPLLGLLFCIVFDSAFRRRLSVTQM